MQKINTKNVLPSFHTTYSSNKCCWAGLSKMRQKSRKLRDLIKALLQVRPFIVHTWLRAKKDFYELTISALPYNVPCHEHAGKYNIFRSPHIFCCVRPMCVLFWDIVAGEFYNFFYWLLFHSVAYWFSVSFVSYSSTNNEAIRKHFRIHHKSDINSIFPLPKKIIFEEIIKTISSPYVYVHAILSADYYLLQFWGPSHS